MRGFKAMAFRLSFALAAACAAAAAPAAEKALLLVPSWKQSHLEEGNQAVQAIYKLAACARFQRREAAEAVLATIPGSAEERSRMAVAVPPGFKGCPIKVRRLEIRNFVLMRGAIAEALYNGDRVRPRGAALPVAEGRPPSGNGSPLVVARWVARCAVSRNPGLAHEVVKYNFASIGEGRALRALAPAFSACLPAGERLLVSRLNIRALIAEELYRASVTFKESFANAQG
jgi:hypothetical protein